MVLAELAELDKQVLQVILAELVVLVLEELAELVEQVIQVELVEQALVELAV